MENVNNDAKELIANHANKNKETDKKMIEQLQAIKSKLDDIVEEIRNSENENENQELLDKYDELDDEATTYIG